MNSKELKELKEKIKEIDTYCTDGAFQEIVDAIEEYTGKYQYIYDDILTESDVIDRIHEIYNLGDIKYYIEDVDTSCYLFRDGNYLANVYQSDLEDIRNEILENLQEEIEKAEKEEIRTKLIDTIKLFKTNFENKHIEESYFGEELATELLNLFNLTLKEEN